MKYLAIVSPPTIYHFHFVGSEGKWDMHREICLFRSWNTLLCARNLKLKFEFQTSLVQNSPTGTSEFPPFDANLDLPWDWIFREIILRDSYLLSPIGVYYASPFLGNYMNGEMVKWRNEYSPLGFYYASPFLGNYTYLVYQVTLIFLVVLPILYYVISCKALRRSGVNQS